jgi:hypothetical protein
MGALDRSTVRGQDTKWHLMFILYTISIVALVYSNNKLSRATRHTFGAYQVLRKTDFFSAFV